MPVGYQKRIETVEQSQVNPLGRYFLMNELKDDIVLTSDTAIDDESVNVSAGHGFTGAEDEVICIFENNRFIQSRVVSVSTNQIFIESPLPYAFTTEAKVIRGDIDLSKDGSSTAMDYKFALYNFSIPVDVAYLTIHMSHAADGDNSKFGGITALDLDAGFFMQLRNGYVFNFGNYTNNGDFHKAGASVEKSDKAPAGTYATEIEFDTKKIYTMEVRVHVDEGAYVRGVVRADLSGLTTMYATIFFSYTSGE